MAPDSILTITIFLPLAGFLLLFLVPKSAGTAIKLVGIITSALTFAISLSLYFSFDESAAGFQFVQMAEWIPGLNISYHVGIDGMSLLLILLTTFLTPVALLGTYHSIETRLREFTMMVLLLEVGMLGVFAALDV
ncbi:MAG: Fe-S-binding domain-containing protein, partial [Proteobacteria bacterium]|nr:Fe-S-binding domain-containing protein [Pseudomonadota bacterium]